MALHLMRVGILVAAAIGLFGSTGCAMLNPDNRPITHRFNEQLVPEKPANQIMASPFILLGGATAFLADTIVHPFRVADDAWRDTRRYCWRGFGNDEHFVSDCASFPLRVLAMPVMYLYDFLARCFFDIEPSPAELREGEDILVFPLKYTFTP